MCLYHWSVWKTGYKWECWIYVLKDHMNETENEIVNFQTDLLIKTRESDAKFRSLVPNAIWPVVKQVSLQVNVYVGSAYWSESGASTVKMLRQGTNTLSSSACIRWLLTEGGRVKCRIAFHTFVGTKCCPKQTNLTQNALIEQNKEKLSYLLNAFHICYSTVFSFFLRLCRALSRESLW
jgi:hypothetical protein